MGNFIGKKKEEKVLMLGLDGSGKTTILYKLKLGEVVTTIPTYTCNWETIDYQKVNYTIYDIGWLLSKYKLWNLLNLGKILQKRN